MQFLAGFTFSLTQFQHFWLVQKIKKHQLFFTTIFKSKSDHFVMPSITSSLKKFSIFVVRQACFLGFLFIKLFSKSSILKIPKQSWISQFFITSLKKFTINIFNLFLNKIYQCYYIFQPDKFRISHFLCRSFQIARK